MKKSVCIVVRRLQRRLSTKYMYAKESMNYSSSYESLRYLLHPIQWWVCVINIYSKHFNLILTVRSNLTIFILNFQNCYTIAQISIWIENSLNTHSTFVPKLFKSWDFFRQNSINYFFSYLNVADTPDPCEFWWNHPLYVENGIYSLKWNFQEMKWL